MYMCGIQWTVQRNEFIKTVLDIHCVVCWGSGSFVAVVCVSKRSHILYVHVLCNNKFFLF